MASFASLFRIGVRRLAWQYDTVMSLSVISWWSFLCTAAAVNVVAWTVSAVVFYRRRDVNMDKAYSVRRWQLALSAVYVFGCAFRSAFPVFDIPRICLFDSWISSVLIGRSVATVAELCFVGQWALLLGAASRATGSTLARASSRAIVPLIAVAEICSWYSVLTTSNLGHIAEESIWGSCAAMSVASMTAMWPRCSGAMRRLLIACGAVGLVYVGFMFLVDVPMYWSRWLADEASGRQYLSIAQGIADVSRRWIVSRSWRDWQHEVAWMTLYFTVAVWFSISLIHAPLGNARQNAFARGFKNQSSD